MDIEILVASRYCESHGRCPGPQWIPGIITEQVGGLTFFVDTGTQTWKCHVDQLKELANSPLPEQEIEGLTMKWMLGCQMLLVASRPCYQSTVSLGVSGADLDGGGGGEV